MRIIVADEDLLALQNSVSIIKSVRPEDEIYAFEDCLELLEFIMENPCEIAFLDARMEAMDGIMLAQEIKKIIPKINIIFLTMYDEYYRQAMEMHASGYILKPLTSGDVKKELSDLRYQLAEKEDALLDVVCFGKFEVKNRKGEVLKFERSKAKELFAYLIHKKGAECTLREAAAVLFEDEPFDNKRQNYIQKIISSMMHTLKVNEVDSVIKKDFNSMAVDTSRISCDYYRCMDLNMELDFSQEEAYLAQYSWADFM
ncbi:MAG: response regulator [Clostridiales bacterium]|nr:response regulator [Clostridiales bacterium]